MIRAKGIPSDRPDDEHQVYVAVDRDGCRILRVTSQEALSLISNRRLDERVRQALRAVTMGEYQVA